MAESTLALTYNDLAGKVGSFLGWGRGTAFGDTAWTTTQTALIDDCVRSGVRRVYSPTPPFDWSFLHPFLTLDLPTNKTAIALPDDCIGLEGDITVTSTPSSFNPPVRITNPGRIKALAAQFPSVTGKPQYAAIDQLKGTTLYAGQRQQLLIFPTPDQDYTLTVQYYVVPDAPSATNPYVYGGAIHAETFLEACLAVAEERQDDMMGIHASRFQERLMASMAVDRRSKAQHLGRNRDTSDEVGGHHRWWEEFPPAATYNGGSFG